MRIIHTDQLSPTDLTNQWERDQVYNGLDCCVTAEILDVLLSQLDEYTSRTYSFSRALQGPTLEMRLRGVLVDSQRKNEVIDLYYDQLETLDRNLDRIVLDGVGMHWFNWGSTADLQRLFYDKLEIPIIKKAGRPTVNRDALERMESYLVARPIVRHLKAMRDIRKKIEVLRTEIDPDGRIRTSYNIAGTNTGRFSSSYSEFGTGGNLQNVEEALRSIFVSDKGMKMAKFDAKSGESYIVGAIEWNLFKDGRYLDACETGDPHTATARIAYPELPWTGDPGTDRAIAEKPVYRHHSARFMCKKLGHGSNYVGKAETLADETKLPLAAVIAFQPKYFKAFPAHLMWHGWVDTQLRKVGKLISLTGRKRQFWGRRNDDEVLRAAVAYDPQCSLADIVNRGMLNVWHRRDGTLYMQDHDAITVQYPEEREDEVIPLILEQLKYPITLQHDRTLLIPYDCKTGWNKADWSENNPDGLKDYIPGDKRRRSPKVHILDRVVR